LFDLALIRPALLANLEDLIEAEGLQGSSYLLPSPMPPVIQISGLSEITYDVAMHRGGDENIVVVQALTSKTIDEAGQMKLDRLLASSGPSSVKEAIQSDPTLGGLVDDLRVVRCSGHQILTRPGENVSYQGAQWFVQVETTG